MDDRDELWKQAQEKAHELYLKMKAALDALPTTPESDPTRALIHDWMANHRKLFPEDN